MFFFIFCIPTFTSKKVVVISIPEQKLKTKLARNTISEENQDKMFAHFRSKVAKCDYFRGFYFCQSVFKSHTWSKYNFSLPKGLKIKILFKKFHILAFWGPKCGPMLGQKWQKCYFHTSHLNPNPVFPKREVLKRHSLLAY